MGIRKKVKGEEGKGLRVRVSDTRIQVRGQDGKGKWVINLVCDNGKKKKREKERK